MKKISFYKTKFHSMLFTSTLSLAIMYVMLLCDDIIAGAFLEETGVAAINAITPITGLTGFFSNIISIGACIIYSREIGEMNKRRADETFGQGMIVSLAISAFSVILLLGCRDIYFRLNNVSTEVYALASVYYRWAPLNVFLAIMDAYLTKMIYTDGDEKITNLSYGVQIVGNILFSAFPERMSLRRRQ